ncbi:MAG: ABC transporter substrate-binding protein, partial [Chloroflexota bacterium]
MSKVRYLKAVLVIAILSLFVLSLNAQPEENIVRVNWGPNDIPSLDPAIATDVSSIQIIVELFPGLTRTNEITLEDELGMATNVDISEDGTVYTFTLIEGIPWVRYDAEAGEVVQVTDADGNVRVVTANDFVYGMRRSVDPLRGDYYGGILAAWVAGGSDVRGATADFAEDAAEEDLRAAVDSALEGLQIEALDDLTIQVTTERPASFITNILGMWMSTAVPSWAIEEFGDSWT